MKRFYNIDPLFNQARRLPLEVNIEQVQGFLATSALPAGASKSWYNSFNFYLMTGLITGSIALYIAFSSGFTTSPEIAQKDAIPPSNEQTIFAGIMPEKTPPKTLIYASEKEQNQQAELPTDEKNTAFVEETPVGNASQRTDQGVIVEPEIEEEEPLLAYSAPEWEDHYYQSPHDMAGTVPDALNTSREIRFLISAEDLTDQVRGTLGKAREYNVRVSELKQKRKRNGNLKHLKVAFAVPHENPSCGWKTFRTVDLKGFKTYEYGWTIDVDGNITDFWDKLNNKEPSEVATPSKTCGQVKYFCKSD